MEDNFNNEDRVLFEPDDFQRSHPDLIKNAYKLNDSILKELAIKVSKVRAFIKQKSKVHD